MDSLALGDLCLNVLPMVALVFWLCVHLRVVGVKCVTNQERKEEEREDLKNK